MAGGAGRTYGPKTKGPFAQGGPALGTGKAYPKGKRVGFAAGGFVGEFAEGMTKGYGEGSKEKRLAGVLPGSKGYTAGTGSDDKED